MTNEVEKKIAEKAKEILQILGENFTGSVEFHCVEGRKEVKYIVRTCGIAK